MPSYRVTVDILDVRPGVMPQDVLPSAERILGRTHQVEDRSLDVARATSDRPQPQIHLRFLVAATQDRTEDAEAAAVAGILVEELDEVARCGRWELRRGPGRAWHVVAVGGPVSGR